MKPQFGVGYEMLKLQSPFIFQIIYEHSFSDTAQRYELEIQAKSLAEPYKTTMDFA